jgi:hypothetical protein
MKRQREVGMKMMMKMRRMARCDAGRESAPLIMVQPPLKVLVIFVIRMNLLASVEYSHLTA